MSAGQDCELVLSGFVVTFRRHRLKGALLALVIVESSLLPILVLERYVQTANYGSFQYGCPSLQVSSVSNDSLVRWVRLACPNGPAVIMSPGYCGVRENPCTHVFPIFTPPRGLLGLYTVDHANPACPDNSHPYTGYLLVTGVGEVYGPFGFDAFDLDYCAVTAVSAGTMEGFSLQWSQGFGGVSPSFRSSVPSNVTVAHGGTATFTMALTSYNRFSGNMSFATGQVSNPNTPFPPTPPTLSFSPKSVILKAGGSNSTLVTIHASSNTALGSWQAQVFTTPVYGLWYYGGFTPAPYAYANGYSSYLTSMVVFVT